MLSKIHFITKRFTFAIGWNQSAVSSQNVRVRFVRLFLTSCLISNLKVNQSECPKILRSKPKFNFDYQYFRLLIGQFWPKLLQDQKFFHLALLNFTISSMFLSIQSIFNFDLSLSNFRRKRYHFGFCSKILTFAIHFTKSTSTFIYFFTLFS